MMRKCVFGDVLPDIFLEARTSRLSKIKPEKHQLPALLDGRAPEIVHGVLERCRLRNAARRAADEHTVSWVLVKLNATEGYHCETTRLHLLGIVNLAQPDADGCIQVARDVPKFPEWGFGQRGIPRRTFKPDSVVLLHKICLTQFCICKMSAGAGASLNLARRTTPGG